MEALHAQIRVCTLCQLHTTRTNAVPGTGPAPAEIMVVGEGPGFNEDLQGKPFVGAAGQLLDKLLAQIGLDRSQVFITNVVKCRPPQNRDPLPLEAETCLPYLRRQFKLVRPKAVLILGRHALQQMLPGVGSISRVHGQFFERSGVGFMPCYHPAAALHNGSLLADLQRDFERVRAHLDSFASRARENLEATPSDHPPTPGPAPLPRPAGSLEPAQLRLL
ncbi:MAG: uracil-DNA glycosylase [Candidatus Dormibacteraeota bacterium]|uniref:Type-4 uracil-DNA glycosylase n=1 Tax=Candidatus Dormiibacter inghamiae TaxID=3127013 RepID=A0A934KJ04_9BACT|nr:uracil-DNA glycosylase [Candidatus Dormibacteraeota bacterium]MBJ7607427.1 uracil-DNA glycosylase [Candidatus Dormibacteraeota bacterium]